MPQRPCSRALSLVLSAIIFATTPALALARGPREPGVPTPRAVGPHLPKESSGTQAIELLGDDLDVVASEHGLNPGQLRKALEEDPKLRVDRRGKLYYQESALGRADVADAELAAGAAAASADAVTGDALALHSRPGSKRVIYLDFDGHVLTGTAWNSSLGISSVQCPPWDIDGSPLTFGTEERARITQIWQRVAEDYAPFDIDVTTEAPLESAMTRDDSLDQYYGVRVLISPISSYFGNIGGRAYVGVFDAYGSAYKPALIFPEKLGNSEKPIGEAVAHEAGHTLGLLHDGTTTGSEYYGGHGTGTTGWAPIMGSGYYKNLTQWSRGEYANANQLQDDYTVIGANGGLPRADDFGNSAGTATDVTGGMIVAAAGVIERAGDVDVVSFQAGNGQVNVAVKPQAWGANLDVEVTLSSADGRVVATSNPIDGIDAAIMADVAAGTYYLSVSGTGKGDPLATGYTGYGSMGAWSLSGTVADPGVISEPPAPNVAPAAAIRLVSLGSAAPAAAAFDASGSTDSDGIITSYVWDFGDGTQASGSAGAEHVYVAAGTYTAKVTVTDDDGASSTASVVVVVAAPPVAQTLHLSVATVSVSFVKVSGGKVARAVVRVVDSSSRLPVSGAVVTGEFSGVVTGMRSGVTGSDGVASIDSAVVKKSGTVRFAVTQVSKTGWIYDPVAGATRSKGPRTIR